MKLSNVLMSIACVLLLTATTVASAETTIYYNMNGYSFVDGVGEDARLQRFSSIVVQDGRIIATGDNGLRNLVEADKEVDFHGKTVVPGLIDAHGHIQGLGQNLNQVDLRGINSKTSSVAQVANYADQNLDLSWIIGRGWNQVLWPDNEFPNRQDIDLVISDRPVWLTRIDGHAGWANSTALELAGITEDTESPDGGEIVKDENGQPTGILIDTAMGLLEQHIPSESEDMIRANYHAAFEQLLSLGITQVHDAGADQRHLDIYKQLLNEGALPLRVNAMIAGNSPQLTEIMEQGTYRDEFDRLQINSVKLYGDGALGSRGAALIEPYSDDPENTGLLVTPEERVSYLFETIHNAGFQVNYHAIGDYSNRLALDTFEQISEQQEGNLRDRRHRVEHAQIVQVADIPRFKTIGIIPSMQPTHATSDMNMAEDRIGPDRIAGAYAWRTFLDQGSIIAAGSDFPVELANPFYGIHAAVTRQDRNNQPVEGWYPEQRMSVQEAIRSFTIDAAYSGHFEDDSGSLEPGKWADFIVLSHDPFIIQAQDLWRIEVYATYVAGERQFKKRH